MSVQNLNSNPEIAAEPDDVVIRRLVRAIDYAEGFWLGFAKSNTPAQRRRLASLCKDLLAPLKIHVLEIELTEPITDILPILQERLAADRAEHPQSDGSNKTSALTDKLAIFVHGLEHSIPSREAYPLLLSSLNLNRELFRQYIPHPLLLWLPDYALTALARKAPDLWAWRSGLYEFAPEREAAEQSLTVLRGQSPQISDNLSKQAKHERLVMLKGLLEDYRELGDGPREQNACGDILNEIGLLYDSLGEWTKANDAFEEALTISRRSGNRKAEAPVLYNLADTVRRLGEMVRAQQLYNESIKIDRELDNQRGIAANLNALGLLATHQRNWEEARKLYNESLEIKKRLGDQHGIGATLNELATLARFQGDLQEARRLYTECLNIGNQLDEPFSVAAALHNLGTLADIEGNREEAARLYREALSIFERLGSPAAEVARQNLAHSEGRNVISD
ncbi:MAG TPA: tetratricopeptide repeat protein [Pyrinomonadaceae bacterium]|nr:tetratricopeptide repeat protein [Pyrinomonadaceae bacterium]